LESCTAAYSTLITQRHDHIVDIIAKAIDSGRSMRLRDVKLVNQTPPFDFLSNKVKQLRPDLTYIRDNATRIEIIEVTVPLATVYGQEEALERAYIEKLKKYATPLDELSMFNITRTTVVVPSLGAFHMPSITKFGTLFRCNQLKF
jgi:hypothetical protein